MNRKIEVVSRRSAIIGAAAVGAGVILSSGEVAYASAGSTDKSKGDADMATHYRTATVNGIRIFYREAGPKDAPVLLLLHGFPTSSRMFRNLIPILAEKYHVIAPDYPAFGHSAVPSRGTFEYTHAHMSEIVDGLLAVLGVSRFGMYCMDFGGPIGYRLMLKYPERFLGAVLQNTPVFGESTANPTWETLSAYWRDKSAANKERVRTSLFPDAVQNQYLDGVKEVSLIDPDDWTIDSALLARPGLDEIMLDLLYDIQNNRATVAAAVEFFGAHQELVMIATGTNDPLFPGSTMKPPPAMPNIAFHPIDSGHFALEDKFHDIGVLTLQFFNRAIQK